MSKQNRSQTLSATLVMTVLVAIVATLFVPTQANTQQGNILPFGPRPAFAAENAINGLSDVGISAYLNTGETNIKIDNTLDDRFPDW